MSFGELNAMVSAYESGSTAKQVAERFGVSESALLVRLGEVGVIRPKAKITPEQVDEMVRLRGAGWTYREISDQFGVTRQAVSRRLEG